MKQTVRCFVAVYPTREALGEIVDLQERLKKADRTAKWVRPDQIHVTLRFMASAEASGLQNLRKILRSEMEPATGFRLSLAYGNPPWPGARVVAMVAEDPKLAQLAGQVNQCTEGCGLGVDERPFRGHLTLARTDSAWKPQMGDKTAIQTFVDRVVLVESQLDRSGAIHIPIEVFEFGA